MLLELHCEKCGDEITWWIPRTKLTGGVSTYLCVKCGTIWDEHCRTLPAFQRVRELECVGQSIIHARELSVDDPNPTLERVLREVLKCELELYQAGLKWLGRLNGNDSDSPDQS